MGINPKPYIMLGALLLVIYTMRHADITPTQGLRGTLSVLSPLRNLQNSRPSERLCQGITFDELFSESDRNRAQSFMNSLANQRGGNPLVDDLNEGGDFEFVDYGVSLLPYLVPWAVFLILSILLCFGFCINWCCMFGICKSCKICNCCKLPKKPRRQKIYMAVSGFFLVGMVGASIAGTIFSTKISKGMEVTFCSALVLFEHLVYGKTEESWMGMSQAAQSITDIQNNIADVSTIADIIPSPDFTNRYTDASTALDTFVSNHNTDTLPHPDPDVGGTYVPDYVDKLEPKTSSTTHSFSIQKELDDWKGSLETATNDINTAVDALQIGQGSIAMALGAGSAMASDVSTSIQKVINDLDKNGKTIMDIFKGTGYGIMGVFIANLVLATFAFISMMMVGVLKIKFFNKLLHFNWCVIIILTILCWILATFFLPSSVVMLEACGVLELSFNDADFFENFLKNIFDSSDSDTQGIVMTCIHGDGNVLVNLGIDQHIGLFETIYDRMDAVNEHIDLSATYTTVAPPQSKAIPAQQALVLNYETGVYSDSDEVTNSLKNLNRVVNAATYPCTTARDTWVLHSGNCTSAMGAFFDNPVNEDFDIPRATCVGFDKWGSKTVSNRYKTSNYASCTSPDMASTISFVTQFVANRGACASLFDTISGIGDGLNDVYTAQQAFSSEAVQTVQGIQDVKTGLQNMEDALIGTTTGLVTAMNCKFLGSDLRTLTDSMCIGFVSSVYISSIIMIVTSFMAFFSTIMIFCLAKKFSVKEEKKDDKIAPKNTF